MKAINEMTKYSLIKELNAIKNANREYRIKVSKIVLKDESLFQSLLQIAYEYENDLSIKAMWVIEYICEHRMDLLAMNFSYFVNNLSILKEESAIRASAKICNLIAKNYNSKIESPIQLIATKEQISKLIEISFECLQSDYKVATKANAMETLYELGMQISWIHYELKLILEKIISSEGPGFKVRATNILDAISNTNAA